MKRSLLIVLVVAVIVVGGAVAWVLQSSAQANYIQAVTPICTGVANINSGFAVYAATTNDFSGLKARCEQESTNLGNQGVLVDSLGAKGVPAKYLDFHKNLQLLISKYGTFYTTLATQSAKWNTASFEEVEVRRSDALESMNGCSMAWPSGVSPIKCDTSWCVALSGNLKKLADSKKSAASPSSGSVVLLTSSMPTGGGTVISLPSISGQISYNPHTSYLATMRSLLGGYKRLRGDLNRPIEIYDNGGSIPYDLLTGAMCSRQNILDAMRSISPPVEYIDSHGYAIETLAASVDAVKAFRDNPRVYRQALSDLSTSNTSRMARLRSIYGF